MPKPIKLWDDNPPGYNPGIGDFTPQITPYLLNTGETNGAVIICPGGGYNHRSEMEGAPVAEWMNRIGLSAFVLDYRVSPYRHPYPMLDAKRAVRMVRYYATEWQISPDKVLLLGFSAGGHLAATVATGFGGGDPGAGDPVDMMSCRPDGLILCYPVITFGEYRHQGSIDCLLGDSPDPSLLTELSQELNVTPNTPPTFIWHTATDASVPVENSLFFADALRKNRVPWELHVFPEGRHGLKLADDYPEVGIWKQLCENWLHKMQFIT